MENRNLIFILVPSSHFPCLFYFFLKEITLSLTSLKTLVRFRLLLKKVFFSPQLEDDIIAKPSYSEEIKNFVTKQESKDWIFLEFSQLGFIGKTSSNIDIRWWQFKQERYLFHLKNKLFLQHTQFYSELFIQKVRLLFSEVYIHVNVLRIATLINHQNIHYSSTNCPSSYNSQ